MEWAIGPIILLLIVCCLVAVSSYLTAGQTHYVAGRERRTRQDIEYKCRYCNRVLFVSNSQPDVMQWAIDDALARHSCELPSQTVRV